MAAKKSGSDGKKGKALLSFPADALANVLSTVGVAARASRVIFPSTPYIETASEGKRAIFSAFNEGSGIRYFYPMELEVELEEKSASVASRELRGLVDKMTGTILLDLTRDGVLGVRTETSRYELRTLAADETAEFPYSSEIDGEDAITFTAKELRKIMRIATLAEGTDKDVEYARCMLIHPTGKGEVRFVTTDGFRLSLYTVEKPGRTERKILLNGDGAKDLLKILPDDETPVECVFGEKHSLFSLPTVQFFISHMNITYPDYTTILGRETPNTFVASRTLLHQALSRASVLAQTPPNSLIEIKPDRLQIYVESEIGGTGEEEVPGNLTGKPLKIGMNTQYLLDYLGAIEGDQVAICYKDSSTVCMLRSPDQPESRYYLMPIRHPRMEREEQTEKEE
ncbi:MAG: DNA polymerase III subunit beta [bacterium JZ-2024 1]